MSSATISILMIEDDAALAEMTCNLLDARQDQRFVCSSAATLAEGLLKLGEQSFQLVLLDLTLPDSQGLSTLQRVIDRAPDLAVIIFTGYDDEALAIKAMRYGAQEYLVKGGSDINLLMRTIRYALQRKEIESEIEKARDQLQQQEKLASLGQLAAGVANEINNPIGFVLSNLYSLEKYVDRILTFHNRQQIMIEPLLDADTSQAVAKLRESAKLDFMAKDIEKLLNETKDGMLRVKALVDNLRMFAREEGQEKEEKDLHQCLAEALAISWNELKYKAEIVKNYGELPLIRCHPQQLCQVFINLLVNAAHAIEKRGTITIKTWSDEKANYVAVRDTGSGIASENLHRVFEPFFTTKESGKGTGLGLSISYEIVTRNHNGEFTVKSKEGEGTEFTVRLPLNDKKNNASSPNSISA